MVLVLGALPVGVRVVENRVLPVGCARGGDRVLVLVLGATSWLCAWRQGAGDRVRVLHAASWLRAWRQGAGAGAGCKVLPVRVVETGCWCRCWALFFPDRDSHGILTSK